MKRDFQSPALDWAGSAGPNPGPAITEERAAPTSVNSAPTPATRAQFHQDGAEAPTYQWNREGGW